MKFNYRYLFALIPLLAVSAILYYFSEIVTYILIAWVISMIGAPVVVYLRRFMGKNMAAISTLSLFVAGFVILVYTFIPPLVNQVDNLSKVDYVKVVDALHEPIRDWENWLVSKKLMLKNHDTHLPEIRNIQDTSSIVTHQIMIDSSVTGDNVRIDIHVHNDIQPNNQPIVNENEEEDFFTLLEKNIILYLNPANIQKILGDSLSAFGDIFIGVFSVFFIAFFFLKEQGLFDVMLTSMVPSAYEVQTKQAVDDTSKLLIRYFIGILLQMFIIAVIVSSGLTFIGVKNALLIGFFAAIINVIPYIGPIIGVFFAMILTISSNTGLSFYTELLPLLYKVLMLFGILHLIDNFVLQPNIFSKSVKAHPLEIFIVVLMGAKIGGIMGMVLAIPSYIVIRVISKVFLSEFKIIQKLTRNI
ncbi:MAG TPA: AI-2E family transporter [Saprospiraceae bacterium]|jgi:predicted PurR-regulated permease PerM|nr:AI-2E family transporter [Saprospiraceae bacterium]HRO09751.1 AI-2E family transporter [Saprospiraceae bacterium]HRP42996.1 AI-2E family transporter [Saprospiraceae bacterium]